MAKKLIYVAGRSNHILGTEAFTQILYELPNGDFELLIKMKVQFFFKSGSGGSWTAQEKIDFMRDWKVAVSSFWSVGNLVSPEGRRARLVIQIITQDGGWMWDNFEIEVKKIKSGDFAVSWVQPLLGNSGLDSEDLKHRNKGTHWQRGAVHEFGHMLGLDDEYTKGHKHNSDKSSIMNQGESLRPRHHRHLAAWIDSAIMLKGFKDSYSKWLNKQTQIPGRMW